ncbi:cytochrome p450 domain-containing protein [Sarocladium implicatum]|nr:cytochrome p450 domain-containing protein [Sarocladium implicatum]
MGWLIALAMAPVLITTLTALHTTICIVRNYRIAKTIGLPIRILFISPHNPLWALVDRKIMIFLRKYIGDNTFTRFNWRGWELRDRCRSFEEMGDAWVLVSSFVNNVIVNDPDAIMSIARRGTAFDRPPVINEMLQVFGPNIAASEGETWRKQRKVITRALNEKNNEIVWNEALWLSTDMIEYWAAQGPVERADEDLRTLSLNVLSRAGFGKSAKFVGHTDEVASADSSANLSYKEALKTILENLIVILAIGPETLDRMARFWLPAGLRKVHVAVTTFQSLMTDMYEKEKAASSDASTDNNLMTQFVKASQTDEKSGGGMTEREIYGNLFAVNFAGHDTTSHTFTFAIYFLAANPAVQDWLAEEITHVLQGRSPQDLDYKTDFPRLKRCLAVMYECLRLYTIVPAAKWTGHSAQELKVGDRTIVIPPETFTMAAYGAVQVDTRWWGEDALVWRPSRWIRPKSGEGSRENVDKRELPEEMDMHKRGAFVGWSEGVRDCPGKKFSQTEFVATMAVLFSQWRVEPVRQEGEGAEDARKRILKLIEDETGYVLLLQMLNPEKAPLRWKKVDG